MYARSTSSTHSGILKSYELLYFRAGTSYVTTGSENSVLSTESLQGKYLASSSWLRSLICDLLTLGIM